AAAGRGAAGSRPGDGTRPRRAKSRADALTMRLLAGRLRGAGQAGGARWRRRRTTAASWRWTIPLVEWGALAVVVGLLAVRATSPDPRIGDDDFGVFFTAAAAIAGRRSAYVGDFVSSPWFALALV